MGNGVWFVELLGQEQTNASRKAHEPYECKVVERHYLSPSFSVTYLAQTEFYAVAKNNVPLAIRDGELGRPTVTAVFSVIPAKAGIQRRLQRSGLDSRLYLKVPALCAAAARNLVPRMCRRLIRAGEGRFARPLHYVPLWRVIRRPSRNNR